MFLFVLHLLSVAEYSSSRIAKYIHLSLRIQVTNAHNISELPFFLYYNTRKNTSSYRLLNSRL